MADETPRRSSSSRTPAPRKSPARKTAAAKSAADPAATGKTSAEKAPAKARAPRTQTAKPEAAKPEAAKPQAQAQAAKPEAAKPEAAKPTAPPSPTADLRLPDPDEISKAVANIAERSQRLVGEFLNRQQDQVEAPGPDPLGIGSAFFEMTTRLMADPAKLVEAQVSLWQDYMTLWQNAARRFMGEDTEPVIKPENGDRRFKDDAWRDHDIFDFIKQSYLLTSRWLTGVVNDVDGLDERTSQKIDFYTRQFMDAIAPSNFLYTNPEVLRVTVESGGENLLKGLENLLDDLERGKGRLRISMTDEKAFEVGRNVAVTPGSVVYQNDMMQIIQYTPTTETVKAVPVLVVPPWINKYYILDLRETNSFVKWMVDQGFTVFVISWVNPDERHADKGFEDYMTDGPLKAAEVIRDITGEPEVNAVGYCLGGTLLATTLAYLKAAGKPSPFRSATFLTTLLDFDEPGELAVFIDKEQLATLDAKMRKTGYLDGADMATTFNMLRANDLIWSFVINNYLLGKEPFPFDLLYWNSDSTRMPAKMHSFYLHNMYERNKLREPGGIELLGTPIDLRTVDTPIYMLSTREDHIAPWKATYSGRRLFTGDVRFVLSGSGHIAGVVNPPSANKYGFWTNTAVPETADDWLDTAEKNDGSWWLDWRQWVDPLAGDTVPARQPGSTEAYPVLEPAPGSYVKVRAI
jgi:polyhydroxyalkanoate synthase